MQFASKKALLLSLAAIVSGGGSLAFAQASPGDQAAPEEPGADEPGADEVLPSLEPSIEEPPESSNRAMQIVDASEYREVPDFDGRPPAPTTAGQAFLWIPRVVLAPFYLVAEHVLRRPLSFVVPRLEQHEVSDRLFGLFRFGDRKQYFLIPTLTVDVGLRTHAGVFFRWRDAVIHGNTLRLQGAVGGSDWQEVALWDRYENDDLEVEVRAKYARRSDGRFWGIGGQGADDRRGNFSWEGVDASVSIGAEIWRSSTVEVWSGIRFREFGFATDGPTLEDQVRDGTLSSLPPGFECSDGSSTCGGYTIHRTGARFALDSRHTRPATGSGLRLSGFGEVAYSLADGLQEQLWASYGADAEAHADLSGDRHVLSLQLHSRFVSRLAGEVPMTELARLSDDGPMAGFVSYRLVGSSAVAATLRYRWPIWVLLDGTLRASMGNVFGPELAGFAWDKLRLSMDLGFTALNRNDYFLELLVGFGTEPFEQGASVDSFRFFLGGKRAF